MPKHQHNRDLEAQLRGWALFVVSALLFILSGWRAGDIVAVVASAAFLLGCVVFMIPLVKRMLRRDESE